MSVRPDGGFGSESISDFWRAVSADVEPRTRTEMIALETISLASSEWDPRVGDGQVYLAYDERKHPEMLDAPCFENMFIKVGFSTNPAKRLGQLQTGSPVVLRISSFPGTPEVEGAIHRLLSSWRSHGEWFHFEPGGRGADWICSVWRTLQSVRRCADGFVPCDGWTCDPFGALPQSLKRSVHT